MKRLAIAAIAIGLACTSCGEDADRVGAEEPGTPVVAPEQQTARLAAVHTKFGNPPRFELVTMDADGARPDVLVSAPRGGIQRIASPAWSPDAKRIYFVGTLREREGDRFRYLESDVFSVDARGGSLRRITDSEDIVDVAPAPDGRTLLVSRHDHPGERPLYASSLWLIDLDGKNPRRMVDGPEGALDFEGTWSPDGTTVVFTRCRFVSPRSLETRCELYAVGRDGSDLRKLAERAHGPAAFSPDGSTIAFVTDRDENGRYATGSDEETYADELYVIDADGRQPRRLTDTHELSERAPSWSPDGSQIAYERTGPSRFVEQVMVMATAGGCAARIAGNADDATTNAESWESPAWRPGRITGGLPPPAC